METYPAVFRRTIKIKSDEDDIHNKSIFSDGYYDGESTD